MMNLQGLHMTGLKHNSLEPRDVPGLKIWLRIPEGITVYANNPGWPRTIADLSGNGNHFSAPLAGYSYAGELYSTSMGMALRGSGGNLYKMACVNQNAHRFLSDGSPFMVLWVLRAAVSSNVGNIVNLNTTITPNYSVSVITLTDHNSVTRTIRGSSNSPTAIPLTISGAEPNRLVTSRAYLYSDVNYGYNVDGRDTRVTINDVLISQQNWNAPPLIVNGDMPTPLALHLGNFPPTYELLMYDLSGYSREEIDLYASLLKTEYLWKRYPVLRTNSTP